MAEAVDTTDLIPVIPPVEIAKSLAEIEIDAVVQAMQSDGPAGAELLLMVHRDGRMTLRAEHPPMVIAAYLLKFATSLAEELGETNQWPEPPVEG